MEPRHEPRQVAEERLEDAQAQSGSEPKGRFKIETLEERIAPLHACGCDPRPRF
jgi:hypothetical protein